MAAMADLRPVATVSRAAAGAVSPVTMLCAIVLIPLEAVLSPSSAVLIAA